MNFQIFLFLGIGHKDSKNHVVKFVIIPIIIKKKLISNMCLKELQLTDYKKKVKLLLHH